MIDDVAEFQTVFVMFLFVFIGRYTEHKLFF